MKMRLNRVVSLGVVLVAAACSTADSDVQTGVTGSAVSATGAAVAGYQHHVAKSKFSVGADPLELDEFGMHKVVGASGVFATRKTGLVTALANAEAPARKRGPIASAEAHDRAVRAYFVQAGVPADQIESVQQFEVVGAPTGPEGKADFHGTVEYRYSMLKRSIRGVSVPDSFAWARVNEDGDVVEEQVYWPAIPQSVVDVGLGLSLKLRDASVAEKLEAALPKHRKGAGLVIHHSPGEWEGPFVAVATYDALQDRESFRAVIHANEAGAAVTLPYEAESAWGPLPAIAPKKAP